MLTAHIGFFRYDIIVIPAIKTPLFLRLQHTNYLNFSINSFPVVSVS